MYGLLFAVVVATQVYRYRRVSGPVERQQTKWAVFGIAATLGGFVALISFETIFPVLQATGTLANIAVNSVAYVILLFIPLSFGVAILRSRLWDIDFIINRALVYSALTAIIIGLYVLVVGGIGALLQSRGSFLLSLLGAGLVAVLFAPLRDRLQRGVKHLYQAPGSGSGASHDPRQGGGVGKRTSAVDIHDPTAPSNASTPERGYPSLGCPGVLWTGAVLTSENVPSETV